MKKLEQHILTLAFAAVWTACSPSDDTLPAAFSEQAIQLAPRVESPETRAGVKGNMDYRGIVQTGFGVFAYATGGADYSDAAVPSLFCNKQVSYTGETAAADVQNPLELYYYFGNWSYVDTDTPLKYWPATDKISFYGYAPYVGSADFNKTGDTGIINVVPADGETAGDPKVTYVISTQPGKAVDLLWGVNQTTKLPWRDQTLETTGGPILMTFHHALSAIGFHVQAIVDKDNVLSDFTDESNVANLLGESGDYKITINQLELTGDETSGNKGTFYHKGVLNLNSTEVVSGKPIAKWESLEDEDATLTVANGDVKAALRHPAAANAETIMTTATLTGVTQTAQQTLVADDSDNELNFMVIPHSAADYKLVLDWYISGKAPDGTYIQEYRTSTIKISDWELQSNVKYYINLVIGLKTLRLNVTATDWQDEETDVEVLVEHGTSASSSLARKR